MSKAKKATPKTKVKATPKKQTKVKEEVIYTINKCMECGKEFKGNVRPCPRCHSNMLKVKVANS